MASIEEIKQRIAVANGESKRLNNERQVSIGKRDALTSQLTTLFAKYKEEYGIELTKDNVDTELQRVIAEKEKEVAKIEQVLNLIKEGRYNEAEAIVNPTLASNNTEAKVIDESMNSTFDAIHTSSEVMNSAIDDMGSTARPTGVVTQQPFVSPVTTQQPETVVPPVVPAPPVMTNESVVSVTPNQQVEPVPPAPPVAPVPPTPSVNNTGISALNGFSEPVGNVAPPTPPTVEEPKQSVSPTSFNAILNGTAFNPSN